MNQISATQGDSRGRFAATGSLVAAVLASSCCIGPLLLVMLGVSGAWIGNLTAFEAYQPVFVTLTIGFLAFGFWQVYVKPQRECNNHGACARPVSGWVVKSLLWLSTVLVMLALTIDLWAPLFY